MHELVGEMAEELGKARIRQGIACRLRLVVVGGDKDIGFRW